MSSGIVPELVLRGWWVRDIGSAGHRLEPEEAGTRFTQVIPPMIPSIQYPARAADPPQSAMSPHEPEKAAAAGAVRHHGEQSLAAPGGRRGWWSRARDCAASIASVGDCCATSRDPVDPLRARAEAAQTWLKHALRRPGSGFDATGTAGTTGLCRWQGVARVPRIPWHSVKRASFRPVRRRRPPPTKRSFYADEGASPDCIESRTCE